MQTRLRLEMNQTTLWVRHFTTNYGHFSTNYIKNFHKTKVLMNILRYQTCLNLNWIKSYDIKHNFFWVPWFSILKEKNLEKLWLINDHFLTVYGHFFDNYMKIFPKSEVQTEIWRCLECLNLNWIKSYKIICISQTFFFMPENASFQGYFAEVSFGTS